MNRNHQHQHQQRGWLTGRENSHNPARARKNRLRPPLDALEPRCLMAVTTTQGLPIVVAEGAAFSGVVAKFTTNDPAPTIANFTANISWGDGGSTLIASVVVDPVLPGVFDVLGTHTYLEEGTNPVTVSIHDAPPPLGSPTSDAVAASVATVSDAALTATGLPTPPAIAEGILFSGTVASFSDADPLGTVSDYSATINWGDGTITSGKVVPGTPGLFNVTGAHTFEEGTFPVSVTITDAGLPVTAVTTFTITDPNALVAPVTPTPILENEGQAFTAQVGAFTDPNLLGTLSDFAVTINWGDLSPTSTGTVTQAVNGTFSVSGAHTYASEGSFPVTFSVKDSGGGLLTAATGVNVTVNDAPLTAAGSSLVGSEGSAIPATALVATFTDTDPNGTVADFTTGGGSVTINWGDGTPVAAVAAAGITAAGAPNGVTFNVAAGHTYIEEGSYKITVLVTDAGGSQTVAHSEADIADVAPIPAAVQPTISGTERQAISGPVASFTEEFGLPHELIGDYTATIDWGDGTPRATGLISQPGGVGTTFVVSGNHTYGESGVNGGVGSFPVNVTIHDDGGTSIVIANTAHVADQAIVLTGQLSPASDSGKSNSDGITNVNTPVFFGTSEPLSHVSLFASPTGGGPLTPIGQAVTDANGNWSLTSARLADGSYTITATAVDQLGQTASSPTQILPSFPEGPLVIDTVGPRVVDVNFQRLTGRVFITFQDDRSGLLSQSLLDSANYTFNKQNQRLPGTYIVTVLSVSGGPNGTDPQTVDVVINGGKKIRGGYYSITAYAAGVLKTSGIQDLAGNSLDGEFYGPGSASGNGIPGGNFTANIDAFHNKILPPATVIGIPHPNDPVGHFRTRASVHAHAVARNHRSH